MNIFNKTVLFPNLCAVKHMLRYGKSINNNDDTCIPSIYSEKYAFSHYSEKCAFSHNYDNNKYMIRIWKTNSIFDYWYDGFRTTNFVASLYYEKHEDAIKIASLFLNYSTYPSFNVNKKQILDDDELAEIKTLLIEYIKNIAKLENKKKIFVDVHYRLKYYKLYYEKEGFVITNRRCLDNSYWIEAELLL